MDYNDNESLISDKDVSSNTNYLINNDAESTSSKNKKSKKLNVSIISENELIQMTKDI